MKKRPAAGTDDSGDKRKINPNDDSEENKSKETWWLKTSEMVLQNPHLLMKIIKISSVEELPAIIYTVLLQSKTFLELHDEEDFWSSIFFIMIKKIGLIRGIVASRKEYRRFWWSYISSVRQPQGLQHRRKTKDVFWKLMVEYITRYAIDTQLGILREIEQEAEGMLTNVWIDGDYFKIFYGVHKISGTKQENTLFRKLRFRYDLGKKNEDNKKLSFLLKEREGSVNRTLWCQDADYIIFEEFYGISFEKFKVGLLENDVNKRLNRNVSYKPLIRLWKLGSTSGELELKSSFLGERLQTEEEGYLFRDYFPISDDEILNFSFDGSSRSIKCFRLKRRKTMVSEKSVRSEYVETFKRGRTYLAGNSSFYTSKYRPDAIFNRYKMLNASSLNRLIWVMCSEDSYGFGNVNFDKNTESFNFSAMDAIILTYDYENFAFDITSVKDLLNEYFMKMRKLTNEKSTFYKECEKYVRNFKVMNYDVHLQYASEFETKIILQTTEGVGLCPFKLLIRMSRRTDDVKFELNLESFSFMNLPAFDKWWTRANVDMPIYRHFLPKEKARRAKINTKYYYDNILSKKTTLELTKYRIANASEVCLRLHEEWNNRNSNFELKQRREENLHHADSRYMGYLLNFTNISSESMSIYKVELLRFDVLTKATGSSLKESYLFIRSHENYSLKWSPSYGGITKFISKRAIQYFDHLKETHILSESLNKFRTIKNFEASKYFMPRTSNKIQTRSGKPITFIYSLKTSTLLKKNLISGVDSIVQRHGLAMGAMLKDEEAVAYDIISTKNDLIRMQKYFNHWPKESFYDNKNVEFISSWIFEYPRISEEKIRKYFYNKNDVLDGIHLLFIGRFLILIDPRTRIYYIVHDTTKMKPSREYYTFLTSSQL